MNKILTRGLHQAYTIWSIIVTPILLAKNIRFMRYNLLSETLSLYYHESITKINIIFFGSN